MPPDNQQPATPPAPSVTPTPPASKNTAVKIVVIILIVLFVLGVIAAGIGYWATRKAANEITERVGDAEQLAQEVQSYPDAYVAAGLPQYPGATVTHLGRKDAKPTDGSIVIVVSSKDSVNAMAEYFDHHLKEAGWRNNVMQDSTSNDTQLVTRTYVKGNGEYNLSIQKSADSDSAATITWTEKTE